MVRYPDVVQRIIPLAPSPHDRLAQEFLPCQDSTQTWEALAHVALRVTNDYFTHAKESAQQ